MEKIDFLPLGSVVRVKNASSSIMVTQRVVGIPYKDKQYLAHYLGCVYPIGVDGKQNWYFNIDDIEEVYFKGYRDEDEDSMQEILNRNIEKCELELITFSNIEDENK